LTVKTYNVAEFGLHIVGAGLARPETTILVGQANLSLRRTGTIVAITQVMKHYRLKH
jgi:hypothetical protein